jgi:O-succinylbenzoate synthase
MAAVIERMRIFPYRLPLARPLVTPAGTLHEREGYLLELTGRNGNVGYGDMAPLPGFSPEAGKRGLAKALAKACLDLWKEPEVLSEYETDDGCIVVELLLDGPLRSWLKRVFGSEKLATTASFGYLSALRDLFDPPRSEPSSIEVNGLLDPRSGDIEMQLEELRGDKYRIVKVKTGSEPGEALKQAHCAAEGLGGDVALRFDANRGWTLGEAIIFCDGIRDLNVEYIEEPLRDARQAEELRARTGVRLAADESLREGECPWADVWVIKPTLDPEWLVRLQRAPEAGKRAVVSACFESGVGIAGLARLATQFPASAQSACGLDTYRWLARDVLGLPLTFKEGRLDLSDVAASMDTVDTTGLECILDE